ncbi:hypothetical protein [Methylopila sp. M107]|uniref:hypothetical protein n=1 Tax=Methylopila sp. M107 TaxID=1101190 RepID=UPI00037C5C1F|nr:hypothetical protein [Methylopila sp. M107]
MSANNIDLNRLRHLIDLAQTQADRRRRLGETYRRRRDDRRRIEIEIETYGQARHGIFPTRPAQSAGPRRSHEDLLAQRLTDARMAEGEALAAQENATREGAPSMTLAREAAEYARSVLRDRCPVDIVEHLES